MRREMVIGRNGSVPCSTVQCDGSGQLLVLELSGKGNLDILTPSRQNNSNAFKSFRNRLGTGVQPKLGTQPPLDLETQYTAISRSTA